MGLYGHSNGGVITQLGMLSLDQTCFITEEMKEEVVIQTEDSSAWDRFSTWFSEIGVVKRIREGSVLLKIAIVFVTFVLVITTVLLVLVCHLKRKQDRNKATKKDIELAVPSNEIEAKTRKEKRNRSEH